MEEPDHFGLAAREFLEQSLDFLAIVDRLLRLVTILARLFRCDRETNGRFASQKLANHDPASDDRQIGREAARPAKTP